MRLAAILLLGASISCFAPAPSPGQTARKTTRFDKERAALREKILAEKGLDYLSKGTGSCQAGVASADLDVNQVRARLYNNGGLFWKGAGPLYNVPKSTASNAIFAAGLWLGGMVDGELHMVASDYGPWEFWPGPLDDDGGPPEDCSKYDRMYSVRKSDIEAYEQTGILADDLRDWPHDLGAPVIDGDGDPNNYNPAGGDRPEVIGDQTIWWVMNDMGNEHGWTLTRPLQVEVQVTAFAYDQLPPLGLTTFYRYEIVNLGSDPIEQTYFGIWVDPDLGDAGDDYVGSDTTVGMGFVWNGDNFDGGSDGYGDKPPAVGFQFLQGPVASPDGLDNDRDGRVDEPGERLKMTKFIYYNGDSTVQGNPNGGEDAYKYLQGLWRDNVPITLGGSGRGFSTTPVNFMFPGNPPEFWSEEDTDGSGSRNTPADRRFLISSGPFTLEPDEIHQVTFAVVFAQRTDRFDSVRKLKEDAVDVQVAFDEDFHLSESPDAPVLTATEIDSEVILAWDNQPSSNNYLDSFDEKNAFIRVPNVTDSTYTFEGYDVLQFESEEDHEGEVIATFDVANDVTTVVDVTDVSANIPISEVVATGTDNGVRHAMRIDGLDNYRDYYFGVQTYAYNAHSTPRVRRSRISRITVRPSRIDARQGGTAIADGAFDATFTAENGSVTHEGTGNGRVIAEVVDPSVLTGDTYYVRFYEQAIPIDSLTTRVETNYDILNSNGHRVFDGGTTVSSYGGVAPQSEDVLTIDGLSFSITGPEAAALGIDGPVANGGAPAFVLVDATDFHCFSHTDVFAFGCWEVGGDWVYGSFSTSGEWIMYHHGGDGPEASIGAFAPHDFEIRVTEKGSYAYHPFSDGNGEVHWVPFEVWDIGINPPFQVNDTSDDVQLIPAILSDGGGTCAMNFGEIAEDPFGLGWPVTDRIYAYYPINEDYASWELAVRTLVNGHPDACPTSPETDGPSDLIDFDRGRPLQRLTFMMDPTSSSYRDAFIPVGNIIRFFTTKPNHAGDVFTVNTEGYAVETNVREVARDALDLISIVPNPYKGASDYELVALSDVARFTNLPERATIRVFNLAGTLVRQIQKVGPETSFNWDLLSEEGLPLASGMYLIHVEVPEVGSKVIKFGLVKKRIQLSLF